MVYTNQMTNTYITDAQGLIDDKSENYSFYPNADEHSSSHLGLSIYTIC